MSKVPIAFRTLTLATGSDCHGHARLGKVWCHQWWGGDGHFEDTLYLQHTASAQENVSVKILFGKNKPPKTSISDEYPHQQENKLLYFTKELCDFISAIPC